MLLRVPSIFLSEILFFAFLVKNITKFVMVRNGTFLVKWTQPFRWNCYQISNIWYIEATPFTMEGTQPLKVLEVFILQRRKSRKNTVCTLNSIIMIIISFKLLPNQSKMSSNLSSLLIRKLVGFVYNLHKDEYMRTPNWVT